MISQSQDASASNSPVLPDVSPQTREDLQRLVFETLFYSDIQPIDLVDSSLDHATGLCSLIASHAGEADFSQSKHQPFDINPKDIYVAARLARDLADIGQKTANILHREHCAEVERLSAENKALALNGEMSG